MKGKIYLHRWHWTFGPKVNHFVLKICHEWPKNVRTYKKVNHTSTTQFWTHLSVNLKLWDKSQPYKFWQICYARPKTLRAIKGSTLQVLKRTAQCWTQETNQLNLKLKLWNKSPQYKFQQICHEWPKTLGPIKGSTIQVLKVNCSLDTRNQEVD